MLTAYNGEAITYDGIGNPTSYRGWGMTWQGGRQLSSMQKDGTTLSFSYNDAGLRTEKTVNGSTRRYIWNSSQLMADVGASDAFYFHYSSGGELIGYTYKTAEAETECILVKNQQGDVERVISADGTILASYTYDAWGNVLTSEGSLAASNPIRYRGYYFDTETSLYYLQSRYYDSAVGRFINGDALIDSVMSSTCNMFSYCGNNPVNRADPFGLSWVDVKNWFINIGNKIEEFLTPSNLYGSTIGGASFISTAASASITSAIKSASRPNNIGAGIFAKQCANSLAKVSKFGTGVSKTLSVLAYGAVAIDVGIGIYDNLSNGASTKKIILDATVDAAITGGTVWAAGSAGSLVGTVVGTVVPGVGNVVGAGAGFIFGVVIYVATDMISYDGKTARTWAKEGINSLW